MSEELRSLQSRVEKLENKIDAILRVLNQPDQTPIKQATTSPSTTPISKSQKPIASKEKSSFKSEKMLTGEFLLNKVGLGLLLFGIAFLFKYSIDQGWLTPTIRIAFGLLLGFALIILGSRTYKKKRHHAQVLLSGGIITFYITCYAAFQILELVSFPVALSFMVLTSVLAFILAISQDESVLAVIGAIGATATPVILHTNTGNLPMLVLYTSLVMTALIGVYFYKGWRSLLTVTYIGSWMLLLIGRDLLGSNYNMIRSEQWFLQIEILLALILFACVTIYREQLALVTSGKWQPPALPFLSKKITPQAINFLGKQPYLSTIVTPLFCLFLSMSIWSLEDITWGFIALGLSMIPFIVSWSLRNNDKVENIVFTLRMSVILLITVAITLLFEGNMLFVAFVTEAAVLLLLSKKIKSLSIEFSGHIIFGFLSLWLWLTFVDNNVHTPPFANETALSEMWYIIAAAVIGRSTLRKDIRFIYSIAGHLALLALFYNELYHLTTGQAYVSIAWGVYGLILLLVSLLKNLNTVRTVALGTLLLLVAKLFIIDLDKLETIWRVLLFLGFGGLFLLVSYYFKNLNKSDSNE